MGVGPSAGPETITTPEPWERGVPRSGKTRAEIVLEVQQENQKQLDDIAEQRHKAQIRSSEATQPSVNIYGGTIHIDTNGRNPAGVPGLPVGQ